jgi:hypothetical protein
MLAVLNLRLPLAQLGQAAQASSASAAIEPALATGLVAWEPTEPSCPVELGAVPDAGRGIPGPDPASGGGGHGTLPVARRGARRDGAVLRPFRRSGADAYRGASTNAG